MQRNMPALFIHPEGRNVEDFMVVMNIEDWIELVKGDLAPAEHLSDPKVKWAAQNAIEAIKKLNKLIEKSI